MPLYRKNIVTADKFRMQQHFNMAHNRLLYEEKQFKLENTLYPFVPVSSKTELGLHELFALCPQSTPLQAGNILTYQDKTWLCVYEEFQTVEAYKKFTLHLVAANCDVYNTSQPFAFLGRPSSTSGARMATFVSGFLAIDEISYYSLVVWPRNHHTLKIERYFKFMYLNKQWQVEQIYSGILPNIVVASVKQIPTQQNSNDPLKPDVDTKHETFDYEVRVQGDTKILQGEVETYTWTIYDKLTKEEKQIPLQLEVSNQLVEIVDQTANRFTLKGIQLGRTEIVLTNALNSIRHTFFVEVMTLW